MTQEQLHWFCDRWLAAWSGNQPNTLLQFYAADAFYLDPSVPKGIVGHDAMRTYLTKLLSQNPTWRWTREEAAPTPKGFMLKWKAEIPVGDQIVIEYGLDLVELKGEKITRNEVYFDRSQLVAAILAHNKKH